MDQEKEKLEKKPKPKTSPWVLVIALIVILLFLGGGIWWWQRISILGKGTPAVTKTASQQPTRTGTASTSKKETAKTEEGSPATEPEDTSATPSGTCNELTSNEKATMKGWAEYNNPVYNVVFKYPEDWPQDLSEETPEKAVFKDADWTLVFSFLIGDQAHYDTSGWTVSDQKTITVACTEATRTYYETDEPGSEDMKIITVSFNRNGTAYLAVLKFKYFGASISSDIVEAFDMAMKTVEFK